MQAAAALCTPMQMRTMLSHILIEHPQRIINIPPVHVTTKLVQYMRSTRAGQFNIISVDSSYDRLGERMTGVVSKQITLMGKMKPFSPQW